jgi:tetratricopeptide (TPR) repeat protein
MRGLRGVWVAGLVIAALWFVACEKADGPRQSSTEVPVTTSSDSARDAYLTGRSLQERLRGADARVEFEKAAAADPSFALAQLGLATTAPTNQEFFAAAKRAEELSINASDGERRLIEAFMAGVNGELERQLAVLEGLEASFPDDQRVQQQLATYHFFTRQDYATAARHLERAIAIEPDFSPAFNLLGYSRRFLDDLAGAEDAFRRYTELIPDEANPQDSYAELLMKMGRFDESIASYRRALEIDPSFVNAYVGIANDLMFQGKAEEARAVLGELRAVAANDAERRLASTWAAVSYLHEGNLEAALGEVRRREAIAAETNDVGAISADRNLAGDILLAAGRLEEAERAYRECVEMSDASSATDEVKEATRRNLSYDLARVAIAAGDATKARELADEYRRQVDVYKIPFELWQVSELEGRIAAAGGDWYGATTAFAEGNPQDPRVSFALAQALEAAGQADSALEACRRVATFNQLNVNYGFVRRAALAMCGA